MDETLKIEVSVRVTRKQGYDTVEIAAAKVEDNAPWDDVKPTAIHFALDAIVEDVMGRVGKQLKAEHARRRELEPQADIESGAF